MKELQAHKLKNIQEGCGDDNQDDNNGDLFMCEGDLILTTPPETNLEAAPQVG